MLWSAIEMAPAPSSPSSSVQHWSCRNSDSSSPLRLWRPAAQRNLRNQWSKLHSAKERWFYAVSQGRSHATSLVNAYLNRKYLPDMDLGVLKDMPGIRKKASEKLIQKQEQFCSLLLSSYKEMVLVVGQLVKAAHSMRCFTKRSVSSSVVQFSDLPEDEIDFGDGGGVAVFSFFPVSHYENLAQELAGMFQLELSLKRILLVELISLNRQDGSGETDLLKWSDMLYIGEFDDLRTCFQNSEDSFEPLPPLIKDWQLSIPTVQSSNPRNSEVFQVYLTTWLVNVNVNTDRLNEIFSIVEEEMQVQLS